MATLKRGAAPALAPLASELVAVQALGGSVLVRELSLEARLDFERALRARKPAAAVAEQDAADEVADVHAMVPHLLAVTVLLDDGAPLYSVQEWRAFGARNIEAAVGLFNTAMRLSGFNADENQKNS